jgi:acyl-CoA synthetase (AMP-forming)/AMP-acid ligase II
VESGAVTSRDPAGALSELLRAAAATRPDAIFARIGGDASDAPAALRAGALDALADHYAARLSETELPQGTRLLLLSAPEPRTLSTIAGALRAGFDVALAAPALDAASIAAAAEACGASVLAGPAAFAELRTGERLFEAAALVDSISLVALHGAGEAGALWLDAPREDDAPMAASTRAPELLVVEIVDAAPKCRSASQERVREVASEFVARAGLREGEAIVSTISLGSEAGLVGGAFAPLIGGAHLIWQAPFAARRFLETLETARTHLFAPAGVASDLGAAGILNADRLSSLTLVAPDEAPAPGFAHGVDPARVFVLRGGAGLRLEGIDPPSAGFADP